MDLVTILQSILIPAIIAYALYNERDKNRVKNKIDKTYLKEDIEKIIDLKMRSRDVQIENIEDNLQRIEAKLDKIIDKLLNN